MPRIPARRRRAFVTILIGGITLLAAWLHWQPPPTQFCRAVDGDTIHCGEQRVRVRLGRPRLELRPARKAAEDVCDRRASTHGRRQALLQPRAHLMPLRRGR
jgi:hypothetical protein